MVRKLKILVFSLACLILTQCGQGVLPVGTVITAPLSTFLVFGNFTDYQGTTTNGLIRLYVDGTIDTDFNLNTGFNDNVNVILPLTDGSGKVYVGGAFLEYNGSKYNRIIRLNSRGGIDTDFAVSGPTGGFNGEVFAIAFAPDGSGDIYVGGAFTDYNNVIDDQNYIVRLDNTGALVALHVMGPPPSAFNNVVRTILPTNDASDAIYVGGDFDDYEGYWADYIIRLDNANDADATFGTGGGGVQFDGAVNTIIYAPDSSGDIYVGGAFSNYRGTSYNKIVRMDNTGTRVVSFDIGMGFDNNVSTIMPATDGSEDIYVGGSFAEYNDSFDYHSLIRLKSDGDVNTTFATGGATGGFNGSVNVVAPVGDGSGDIYVGGAFTDYNGTASNYLLRLNSDGTVDTSFDTGGVGGGFDGAVTALSP